MINVTIERKHVYLLAVFAVIAALLVPTAAWGLNKFNDVPASNAFHDDITWIANAGVTLGCNVGGTLYCPDGNVTRGEMAAFLKRLATNKVVDAKTNSGLSIVAGGTIKPDGTIAGGTGNFTVTKTGTGDFSISISGTSYIVWYYVTSVTPTGGARTASFDSLGGKLLVDIFSTTGARADDTFSFIIYDQTP